MLDAYTLSSDLVIYSVYGDQLVRNDSLLAKRTLDVKVDLIHVDAVEGYGRYCCEKLFVSDRCGL